MDQSVTDIFRVAAKALGQIACQKLMNEIFKEEEVVVQKVVAKTAEKVVAKAAETNEARWGRWTKQYTESFKKCLTDAEVPHDDKEFDKLKKEFVKYLNDLTVEDYKKDTKTHPDRMKDFADLKAPKKEAPPPKTEAAPAAAGAGKPKAAPKKKTMWEEMNAPSGPPSNAADIHDVKDIEELQNNNMLVTVDGAPEGVFWDGKNGRWVRGPSAADDEDLVEVKFKGEEYMVGEVSCRVYRETDNRDEFVGYLGVGKFSDMRMP